MRETLLLADKYIGTSDADKTQGLAPHYDEMVAALSRATSQNCGNTILDRLKAAEKDTERLDWLDGFSKTENHEAPYWTYWKIYTVNGTDNLRQAIDALNQKEE